MRHFPYDPAKPLPNLFYNSDNFLEKYNININRVQGNISNRLHYHDFFQIYYVVSGTYKDTVNGQEIICDSGSVVLIMPYTVHAPNTKDALSENPDIVSLSFRAEDFQIKGIPFFPLTFKTSAYENKILPTVLHICHEDKPLADRLMSEIHSEYKKKSDMFLTKLFDCLNAFLFLCAKASDTSDSPRLIHSRSVRTKVICERIREIKKGCAQKLLIDDIAASVMMSRSTFTKNFREVTGMTFHDVVTQIRLMKAVELLRYTKKSIAEIASEVGFSSNAHFTKECIKMFRLPPQPLRREMAELTRMHKDEITKWDMENAWANIRPTELRLEHFNNSIGNK